MDAPSEGKLSCCITLHMHSPMVVVMLTFYLCELISPAISILKILMRSEDGCNREDLLGRVPLSVKAPEIMKFLIFIPLKFYTIKIFKTTNKKAYDGRGKL